MAVWDLVHCNLEFIPIKNNRDKFWILVLGIWNLLFFRTGKIVMSLLKCLQINLKQITVARRQKFSN
jgi:hypothetical protein